MVTHMMLVSGRVPQSSEGIFLQALEHTTINSSLWNGQRENVGGNQEDSIALKYNRYGKYSQCIYPCPPAQFPCHTPLPIPMSPCPIPMPYPPAQFHIPNSNVPSHNSHHVPNSSPNSHAPCSISLPPVQYSPCPVCTCTIS